MKEQELVQLLPEDREEWVDLARKAALVHGAVDPRRTGVCPCGIDYVVIASKKAFPKRSPIHYCSKPAHRLSWHCARCLKIPDKEQKDEALSRGEEFCWCTNPNCARGVARLLTCAGWNGNCDKLPPRDAFTPGVITLRKGEPWRCLQCATRRKADLLTDEERQAIRERALKVNSRATTSQKREWAKKDKRTPEERSAAIRKGHETRRKKST